MKEDAIIKALEHSVPFEEVSTLGGDLLVSDEAEKEGAELKKDSGTADTEAEIDDNPTDTEPTEEPGQTVDNQEPFKV
jgi:hypothetical protein